MFGRRGRPAHPDVLTPAEWRVLDHLREGRTNAEIAVRLGISPDGVKFHVSNMLAKLGLPDRTALASWEGVEGQAASSSRSWTATLFAKLPETVALKIVGTAVACMMLGAVTLGTIAWFEGDDSGSIPDLPQPVLLNSLDIQMSVFVDLGASGHGGAQQTSVDSTWVAGNGIRQETTTSGNSPITSELLATAAGVFSWTEPPPDGATTTRVEALPGAPEAFIPFDLSTAQPPPTLRSLVKRLARGGRARLAGEDVIAGRDAYRIEISPGSCPPPIPGADGLQTYWLDKETFTVLGHTVVDKAGRVIIQQRATSVRYNTPIDPSAFSVPAGADVEPSRDSAAFTRTDDICFPSGFKGTASAVASVQSP